MKRILLITLLLIFATSCGSEDSCPPDVPLCLPVQISRIAPVAASAGATVTIFGYGFAAAAPMNVVNINGTDILAASYGLVTPATSTEIEQITFVVPAGLTLGAQTIYVYVVASGTVSNTDLTITINP